MACGCKRSPTGKCIGWHRLTEEEYEVKLAGYNDIKQQLDIAKNRLEVAEAEKVQTKFMEAFKAAVETLTKELDDYTNKRT
jgi:hypothetical protein